MCPLGHVGFALLLAAVSALVLDGRRAALITALALSVALVPDLDGPLALIHHHGRTHTVAFAVAASLVVGLASHLIADAVTVPTAGNPLQPFWPVSDAVVSYPLIPPGSTAWNVGLLVAGLLVNLVLHVGSRRAARRVVRAFGGRATRSRGGPHATAGVLPVLPTRSYRGADTGPVRG